MHFSTITNWDMSFTDSEPFLNKLITLKFKIVCKLSLNSVKIKKSFCFLRFFVISTNKFWKFLDMIRKWLILSTKTIQYWEKGFSRLEALDNVSETLLQQFHNFLIVVSFFKVWLINSSNNENSLMTCFLLFQWVFEMWTLELPLYRISKDVTRVQRA